MPAAPQFLVAIDPAHGGADTGAALAQGVAEKDLTLSLARRLKAALEASGVAVLVLRDGDTELSAEQRAEKANAAGAAVFISLHAGNIGHGVRTYTARLQPAEQANHAMLPWDTAQAAYLADSRALAASIGTQLARAGVEHAETSAPVKGLNFVTSAAAAIELLPGPQGLTTLLSPEYQQRACAAVAQGILAERRQMEAGK